MLSEHVFAREEVLPSWWANKVSNFLSLSAAGFQITLASPTTIEVIAGADEAAAIIAVSGSWRWVEATVSRAHPGGAAGTYDIYVTAKATDITSTPVVFTDATDYAWDLAIVAHGATPPIVAGTVDIFRKVGELQWDGAAITRIDQLVPATARHTHTHATGQPDAIAPADIGAVATGSAGTLASLHLTGAGTALAVDHDATVGGTLAVTGASTLAGLVTAQAGLSLDAGSGTAGQTLTLTGRTAGAAVSSTLAVSAAGALTVTSGTASLVGAAAGGTVFTSSTTAFNIPGTSQYQVGGTQIALSNLSNATTGTGTTVVLSASPTLTGVPLAPTAAPGTNTTQLATTAFVTAAVGAVAVPVTSVFGRTGAVVKVAGDYAVADVTGAAPLASPTLTGTPAAPTAAVDTNTTQIATTAFVLAQAAAANPVMNGAVAVGISTRYARADHVHPTDTSRAAVASPTFTGVPAGPTAAVDTNTTQFATTAFVLAQAAAANPVMNGAVAVGVSTRYARADHVHPTDTTLAALAGPTFTGTVTIPTAAVTTFSGTPNFSGNATAVTQAANDNSTRLATTAYVDRGSGVFARMTADIVATNAMQSATGLSFAIGAGEVWTFECVLYVQGGTNGTTFAVQVTGPASPTTVAYAAQAVTGGSNSGSAAAAFSTSVSTTAPISSMSATRIIGIVVNGANAGTIQIQFLSGATSEPTVKTGSFIRATKGA